MRATGNGVEAVGRGRVGWAGGGRSGGCTSGRGFSLYGPAATCWPFGKDSTVEVCSGPKGLLRPSIFDLAGSHTRTGQSAAEQGKGQALDFGAT